MPKKKPILMVVFALTLLFSAILPSASTQQPRPFTGIPEIRRLTPVEVLEEKPAAILDYTLHTTAGKFKPAITDVEAIVAAFPGEEARVILQFKGPILREWRESLKAMGVRLHGYVPNYGFVATVPVGKLRKLASLPFMRWMGAYTSEYKLGPMARQVITEGGSGWLRLLVRGFEKETMGSLESEIRSLGGVVVRKLPLNTVLAVLPAESVNRLARSFYVFGIDVLPERGIVTPILRKQVPLPYYFTSPPTGGKEPPGVPAGRSPMNYWSTRLLVGSYWMNLAGYDGSGQVIMIGDTGLDTGDTAGVDNDGDGLIDEDGPDGTWVNDDGDYLINEDDPDDDCDGVVDEDPVNGVDDDGDFYVDEDPVAGMDEDGDGLTDEDEIDGVDNDGDGLVDEDPSGVDNDWDGLIDEDPVELGVDNDGDGLIDEDPGAIDNDGDGLVNEDPYDDDGDGRLNEDPPNCGDSDGDGLIDEDGMADDIPVWGSFTFRVDDDGDGFIDEDEVNDVDNDRDGLINEDPVNGVDDDGDGLVDEDPAEAGVDDDGDGLVDEDPSGIDNDGDGLIDEDPPAGEDDDGDGLVDEDPIPYGDDDMDGLVDEDPVNGVDDDGDGYVDEDPKGIDNDGDGLVDEDTEIWPDFLGKLACLFDATEYWSYTGDGCAEDFLFHGTHVSETAAGLGTSMCGRSGYIMNIQTASFLLLPPLPHNKFLPIAGVAPGADIAMVRFFGDDGYWRVNYNYLDEFVAWAMVQKNIANAVISSNSWGYTDTFPLPYSLYEAIFDAYVRGEVDADGDGVNEPPTLFVFAAGNEGPMPYTLVGPAHAKNVIAVGSTTNYWLALTPTPDQISDFSSRGPTADGRIKPDVVAPGEWVAGPFTGMYYYGWMYPEPIQHVFAWAAGTSMATPHVAGAAAIWRQMISTLFGVSLTPAAVKALLINTADRLGIDPMGDSDGNGNPDLYDLGWGRISFLNLPPTIYIDDNTAGIETGVIVRYEVEVSSGTPFKATLVWSDYPASPPATIALVNDLGLRVIAPDGTVYYGNDFTPPYDDRIDVINNVENVFLDAPADGRYIIEVWGGNVPMGPQPYALILSGKVESVQRTTPPPVGGEILPPDKIQILAVLAVEAVVPAAIAAVVVLVRRRKRSE